ncbi:DUF4867 family protein [Paenibacillus peoriae]|uniref:DUF4867 family protein n=1 Tax=Paenibacillus peoriae TaxID=59893 RepID=UPI00026C5C79|nr:DUF4867 family protein [Paenibacillus peoriae]MEC0184690.1 DUF4867 family protein [Paenibacillus peoriae]
MGLNEIRHLNAQLVVNEIFDDEFLAYGKVLGHYNFDELLGYVNKNIGIPSYGNQYFTSNLNVEQFSVLRFIREDVYGQLPIQAGTCSGQNSKLNGLEYHQGSEVVIAATDCIHLVGKVQDIVNHEYHSGKVRAFLQRKGTAIELYSTTLHYAPCKTEDNGYLTVVLLPLGTNEPLDEVGDGRNKLVVKKNKFLMVHSSQHEKIAAGVHPGIIGENIEVQYKS